LVELRSKQKRNCYCSPSRFNRSKKLSIFYISRSSSAADVRSCHNTTSGRQL